MARKKSIEQEHLGPEPDENYKFDTDASVARALSWYNYFFDLSTAKGWLETYLKKHNLGKISDIKEVNMTMCSIARMLQRNLDVPERLRTYLDNKIAEKSISEIEEVKKVVSRSDAPICEIEEILDEFYNKNYSFFDPKVADKLKEIGAKQIDVKKSISHYKELVGQLNDPDFKEYYETLPNKSLTSYKKFLDAIIEQCEQFLGLVKKPRKPRKKKVKGAADLAKKAKFLGRWNGIEGKNPATVVGTVVAWVYNTKYKKLVKIVAEEGQQLSVKGTSIINYDEKRTVSKIVRKPDDVVPKLANAGKSEFNKLFKELRTRESVGNGRLNDQTLILKAFK